VITAIVLKGFWILRGTATSHKPHGQWGMDLLVSSRRQIAPAADPLAAARQPSARWPGETSGGLDILLAEVEDRNHPAKPAQAVTHAARARRAVSTDQEVRTAWRRAQRRSWKASEGAERTAGVLRRQAISLASSTPRTSAFAFGDFKRTYLASMSRNWENDREAVATGTKSSFGSGLREQVSTSPRSR